MKIKRRAQIVEVGSGIIKLGIETDPSVETIEIPAIVSEEQAAGKRLYDWVTLTIEIPDE